MGVVRRLLELCRPSLAAVIVGVLILEFIVGQGRCKVSLNKIKAPLSPLLSLSTRLLCQHQQTHLPFLQGAPCERRTTSCYLFPATQIHSAPLASAASSTATSFTSIRALSLPDCSAAVAAACAVVRVPVAAEFPAVVVTPASLRRRRRSLPFSHLWHVWPPPVFPTSMQFGGSWLPSFWGPQQVIALSVGGCWRLLVKSRGFQCYCAMRKVNSLVAGNFKVGKGTSYNNCILCILFGNKYGSGNALVNVRADLRSWSMLVLRFNIDKSRAKFLSSVKQIRHLQLKISNPRRHRPIRQPRGAPAVLSECNKEDPGCLWRDHPLMAQRPRWRYHPCLLHQKCRNWLFRLSSTLEIVHNFMSHLYDSFVVAQKLHFPFGMDAPKILYSVLYF